MSGSIDLTGLFGGDISGSGPDLISTLYGYNAASTSKSDPLLAIKLAEINEKKEVATTAKDPQVARDIKDFKAAIAKAKTPAELLKNPTVLKVLLTTNGLSDQIGFPALAQKVLLSDSKKTTSLVSQLANANWTAATKTFDFANQGLSTIKKPSVIDTVTNAYAEVSWRQTLDKRTPGLSNALTFKQNAASVKSVDQILGDQVLRDVVTTALGIPKEIAFQSLPTQEHAISARLDIKKLKDTQFVTALTDRYLLNKASQPSAAAPSLDQLALQSQGIVV